MPTNGSHGLMLILPSPPSSEHKKSVLGPTEDWTDVLEDGQEKNTTWSKFKILTFKLCGKEDFSHYAI